VQVITQEGGAELAIKKNHGTLKGVVVIGVVMWLAIFQLLAIPACLAETESVICLRGKASGKVLPLPS
jgi:hypothetical protein